MNFEIKQYYYFLGIDNVPVECDAITCMIFMETDRTVEKTKIGDDVEVSTVFLGLNHNHFRQGPPILFETLVFGGSHDGCMNRYVTWDEAKAGHKEMVEMILLESN